MTQEDVLIAKIYVEDLKRKSACNELETIIEVLEAMSKILDIIKIEQQPTTCEYTKLKSFAEIEKIVIGCQMTM